MSLPLLKLSLRSSDPTLFADQLRKACHEIGFFLLQHDIPEHICKRALSETEQFFKRSLEEKMTISYEHSPAFRGYMPLGVENTEGKIDGREQIEYAAEFHDLGHRTSKAQYYHRLRSVNPWPDAIQPGLRPVVMDYVRCVLDVADKLRDSMCDALKVDSEEVGRIFGPYDGLDPNFWSMKLVSYPAASITQDESGEPEQGVGAHTDSNFMTLICQDPKSSGLQVQNVQGKWIDVLPTSSDVLICNIGELAQIWSNGYFLATPHRVLRHSSNTHSRTSLPIFYNPKIDTVMKPINTNSMKWTRVGENQWRRENNQMMSSVGENSFKSLARSHPRVFERHHGDLTILEDGRIIERE